MSSQKHWEVCNAPICNDERGYAEMPNWRSEVVWLPGEPLCSFGRAKWKKKQEYVNRSLQRGNLEKEKLNRAMTTRDLMER